MDKPMIWFWVTPEKRVPLAHYDHGKSEIHSSDITYSSSLAHARPEQILLYVKNARTPDKLTRFHCLAGIPSTPLIDDVLRPVIEKYAGGNVEFVKATVRVGETAIDRYSFARPLVTLDCTDREKSDIRFTTTVGDEVTIHRFGKIVLKPGCMGGHHFARLLTPNFVIVSDELKRALDATGDPGLGFELPENYWRRLYNW